MSSHRLLARPKLPSQVHPCSPPAFVVWRIHVHAACFCLVCPLGLHETDSGRNPPASAPNSHSALSEQCRRAGTSRIPAGRRRKPKAELAQRCRQTGPANHLKPFPLALSLLTTPRELPCRWQPHTARYNLCWCHPLSCPQPASRIGRSGSRIVDPVSVCQCS